MEMMRVWIEIIFLSRADIGFFIFIFGWQDPNMTHPYQRIPTIRGKSVIEHQLADFAPTVAARRETNAGRRGASSDTFG